MILDLSSFNKALSSLDRALVYASEREAYCEESSVEAEIIRAAVIQNFEFTYELCWKFMKRWLELNLMPGLLDGASRRELFRQAVEHRLIDDFHKWLKYHELRNTTSHTYNSEVAEDLMELVPEFYNDALALYRQLEAHNE